VALWTTRKPAARSRPMVVPRRQVTCHQNRCGRGIDLAEDHRELRLPDVLAQPIAEAVAEWRLLPVLRQPQLVGEIDWIGRHERKLLGYVLRLLGNVLLTVLAYAGAPTRFAVMSATILTGVPAGSVLTGVPAGSVRRFVRIAAVRFSSSLVSGRRRCGCSRSLLR
jgi:hypothetical protein